MNHYRIYIEKITLLFYDHYIFLVLEVYNKNKIVINQGAYRNFLHIIYY